ncbi:hypothetical protein D3C73_20950 [compost metagenome]
MQIGKMIKDIRIQKNISQDQMASDLGVSRQAVSKWENNSALPDIENIMYISDLYGVSLDALIKNDKNTRQQILIDSAAKKWHWLSVLFFMALILYVLFVGYVHGVWHVGLGIATIWMLGIQLWVIYRKRPVSIRR